MNVLSYICGVFCVFWEVTCLFSTLNFLLANVNTFQIHHTIIWICPSVCLFHISSAVYGPITTNLRRRFYHTIIYHQFVRVRVREEPHWQGTSNFNMERHFGIGGPWAWTLDLEMLDSGPRFRLKNTQNLVYFISLWTGVFRSKVI